MEANIVLLMVGLVLSFFMAYNLGANDASTPCSIPVGARAISIRNALILFIIFSSIGAISQGYMNTKTISGGIIPEIDIVGAIAISLAAGFWSFFCSWKGLEISNTYTVIGGLIGYALLVHGSFNSETLLNIVISWAISPILSIGLAYIINKFMTRIFHSYLNNKRFLNIISNLLIVSLCFSAYSFGVNDIGNAIGVYVAVTQEALGVPSYTTMAILAAFGAVGMAVGGLTLGHRVVETVAFRIVRLDIISGFVAEITNASILYLFVAIPYIFLGYGLPISSSIVGVGAIIGAGSARAHEVIDKTTIWHLVSTWVITIPVTAILSAIFYFALSQVLK